MEVLWPWRPSTSLFLLQSCAVLVFALEAGHVNSLVGDGGRSFLPAHAGQTFCVAEALRLFLAEEAGHLSLPHRLLTAEAERAAVFATAEPPFPPI